MLLTKCIPLANESFLVQTSLHPRWRRRVDEAIHYIHRHYYNHISPEGLSIEVKLSVPKLQQGLKYLTGYTLNSYQEKVRVSEAKELLAQTDLPIRVVARKVGFKTHSHFGDTFKKVTGGVTPSAYRNLHGR
jgi:two-component system, response regulator YesN